MTIDTDSLGSFRLLGARVPRAVPARIAALAIVTAAGLVGIELVLAAREWLVLLLFAVAAALVVASDLRWLRAPNAIVYPALAGVILLAGIGDLATSLDALAGGLLAFGPLLVAVALSRGAMGMGDAKFGALCGTVTGLGGVWLFLAASFVAGGVFASIMLVLRRRTRRDVVPFTPFLVTGTFVALAAGRSYLGS
jgi:leader peptidase (prepilin peptidase)/N-methyltransferase